MSGGGTGFLMLTKHPPSVQFSPDVVEMFFLTSRPNSTGLVMAAEEESSPTENGAGDV